MISYNNIVARFQKFVENHKFLREFSHGSPEDVDQTKDPEYPLLHLVLTGTNYQDRTPEQTASLKTYSLNCFILDLPPDKEGKVDNQKEVISDSMKIAEDIISDIINGFNVFVASGQYYVTGINFEPLEEETKNVLAGGLLSFDLTVPFTYDACDLPLDGVTEPGQADCENATYRNSDGTFVQAIAAGATYTSPDITVTQVDGNTSTTPSNTNVTCSWATVKLFNSANTALESITSFPAGGNYTVSDQNLDLLNGNDTVIQNIDHVVGGDIVIPDVTITDSASSTTNTENAINILLPNTTVTSASTSGGVMTINTPSAVTPSGICYQNTHPVFATSFVSDDSYDSFLDGDYDSTPPTFPEAFAQLDYDAEQSAVRATPASGTAATDKVGITMLKQNNAFGNKFRFTDDQGNASDATVGSNLWAHVDWNNHSWTGATQYYVIDHLTGWGYTQKYADDGGNVNLNTGSNTWAQWIAYISTVTWESTYSGFIPLDLSELNNAHGAKCMPNEVWASEFFEFDAAVSGSGRGAFLTGESLDSSNFYQIYDSGNNDMCLELTKATSSGFQSRLTNVFMKRKHY